MLAAAQHVTLHIQPSGSGFWLVASGLRIQDLLLQGLELGLEFGMWGSDSSKRYTLNPKGRP
jgi:hypothetical protein